MVQLCEALMFMKQLKELNLSYISMDMLSDENRDILFRTISVQNHVTYLTIGEPDLHHNSKVVFQLCDALKANTSITTLDLSCARLRQASKKVRKLFGKLSRSGQVEIIS
jgi:hypothetical protein